MTHQHLIVISGSVEETRRFCRDTGITPRRVIHATALSVRCCPPLPVVRVGDWYKRRDLEHIERLLAHNARTTSSASRQVTPDGHHDGTRLRQRSSALAESCT